jgi:hypothetical protein
MNGPLNNSLFSMRRGNVSTNPPLIGIGRAVMLSAVIIKTQSINSALLGVRVDCSTD